MIRLSGILISAFTVFVSTVGCDSSLQVPKNQDELASLNDTEVVNGQVYSDVSDERQLPYVCEEQSECEDLDPCTRDRCQNERCNYTMRDVALKAHYIETAEPALDVSIEENRLIVAMGSGGIESHDISDPDSSTLEGSVSFDDTGDAISVEAGSGGMAVSLGESGMLGVSIPGLTTSFHVVPDVNDVIEGIDEVYNVDIGPRYGFTSGYIDGFLIHTWVSMTNASLVTGFDTTGRVYRVASTESLAVVADALGGALVYGFDTETGISEVSKISTEGRMMDVDVVGDSLIMAEYGTGFSLVDLSDMDEPKRLADVYTDNPVTVARLMGSQTAVVGEENGRISIYDVSLDVTGEKTAEDEDTDDDVEPEKIAVAAPRAPILLDAVKLKGEPLRIDVENDLIAIALGEEGVALLTTGCELEDDETEGDTETAEEAAK